MTATGGMSGQRAALSLAMGMRRGHVRAVAEGILDPFDVIDAARSRAGIPLRRLHLELLFRAVREPKPMNWPSIRARLLAGLGEPVSDDKLDIGWVLDVRAGGRRYYALREACRPSQQLPWEGFPWDPLP